MKVIIAGSRGFSDYPLLERKCNYFFMNNPATEIISGTAKGADTLGEDYARSYEIPVKQFPADWKTHGKSAGYLRNEEMAAYADALIVFWDGKSKRTNHMVESARKAGLPVRIVKYNE
jgi:hypothetical protein